jgi:small-conductance mechanosensitive channel
MQDKILGYWNTYSTLALEWLTSPQAWVQFGLIIVAYLLAVYVARYLTKFLTKTLTPKEGSKSMLSEILNFVLLFLPLLLPGLAYVFLGIGEQITLSTLGAGEVIGFGKRLFILLGAYTLVHQIVYSPFLKLLGKYVVLPVAALSAFGLVGPATEWLGATGITVGNISFSLLAIVRGLVFGGILFWLGRWSNDQSANYIRSQKDMRVPTRELATKAVEMTIFGACFLLLMNIMGINLSALAVLGGAIGVGLGFGLQKIASNFISGIILLLEGQATVGDFVELDGGESGTIVKMMSRATILETFDGKWIVVPNEDFITTRIINWSDAGSGNRYEVEFSVSYDTDINLIPGIVEKAVASHQDVLSKPEKPDCELRGFGESGIDFAVEFWVEGIDDGKNKYSSDVLFLVWNALKDNNIEIPYPQRVLHIKGDVPKL